MNTPPTPPAFIEYTSGPVPLRFLVFDAPNDTNLPAYINEFKRYHVRHIVRVCDPTYSVSPLEDIGIKVHDWAFPDGNSPPKQVLHNWAQLVHSTFSTADASSKTSIGVHCVAGLGRAPVLVAVALIEAGMDPLAAVQYVRQRRPNSINASQLRFLKEYKPQKKENCLIC